MFGFRRSPLEQRAFAHVWPRIEDIQQVIGSNHPALSKPVVLLATTAIPNLVLAAGMILEVQALEKARATIAKIESLMFQRIATDQTLYQVSSVLKLSTEQRVWNSTSAAAESKSSAKLETLIEAIFTTRVAQYHEECLKGMKTVEICGLRAGSYGFIGFLTKRWLSEINGIPILRSDEYAENGFEGLGVASIYFSNVLAALSREIL